MQCSYRYGGRRAELCLPALFRAHVSSTLEIAYTAGLCPVRYARAASLGLLRVAGSSFTGFYFPALTQEKFNGQEIASTLDSTFTLD